jgi:hypothetical protein
MKIELAEENHSCDLSAQSLTISKYQIVVIVAFLTVLISACNRIQAERLSNISQLSGTQSAQYLDSSQPISARVEDLVKRLMILVFNVAGARLPGRVHQEIFNKA